MATNELLLRVRIDDKGQLVQTGQKAEKAGKGLEKGAKGAHSMDRRLKGAAQASSSSTKNFSKMSQGISGGLVPAYATLAASMFAVTAVFRGLEQAFNWKAQSEGLAFFADQTGIAMQSLVREMRSATVGLLNLKDAAQAAQIGIASGLNPKDLVSLAEAAKLVSGALGRDLTDSFNRLIRGVTKAEPELLDELGIVLRLDIATRKYAAAHGLVQNQLTLTQRMAAVNAEVMGQVNAKFGEFRQKADDLANPFTRLQTAFTDLMKSLSETLLPPLIAIANFLSENTEAAALLMAGFAASILRSAFPALKTLSTSMIKFGTDSKKASGVAQKEFKKASRKYKMAKNDWNAADVVHKEKFKAILTKMGIDHKKWLKKKVVNQERSLAQMLNNEKKLGAKVRLLKKGELAYIRKIHGQIAVSHQNMVQRMIAGSNAAAAGMTAAMAKAGAASSAILVGLGGLAKRLAPTFAFLGSAMGWLFGLATAVFIGKFIWDWAKGTGVFDKKVNLLEKSWENVRSKLREIDTLMNSQINNIDLAEKGTMDYNDALVKQANIYANLADRKILMDAVGGAGPSYGSDSGAIARQTFFGEHIGTMIKTNEEQAILLMERMQVSLVDQFTRDEDKQMLDILMMRMFSTEGVTTEQMEGYFKEWLEIIGPLLARSKVLTLAFGEELLDIADNPTVDAGNAIKRLRKELESLVNVQDRLTTKFKMTSLQQYRQAIMGTITEATTALKADEDYDFVGELNKAGVKPGSLGIDKTTKASSAIDQLGDTQKILDISHKLTRTLGIRVARHKRMADIAGKLGDSYGKQEARLFKIQGHQAESEELTARILANTLLYSSLDETAKENAAEQIANDYIKLENLGYQIESLKEMNDLMISIRDAGIQAFDRAGQKGIKDLLLGKEKSLGDAVLNVAKGTLEGMATALSEKMMAPITGGLKKMLGIESPEDKQKKVLQKHVTDMREVLEAHIVALGGDASIIGDMFDNKKGAKLDPDTGLAINAKDKGFMDMIKSLFGGAGGAGGGGWMSSLFSLFGGMFGAKGGMVRRYAYGTGPAGATVVPGTGSKDTVPAMLTPGELVIPKGKRVGGNYNTTINVNMEGGGDVTTDDDTGEMLGMAIQVAVTEEIANQQRPGGLLSPFGGG